MQLSSLVRNLFIVKDNIYNNSSLTRIFGISDAEWTPIIIEMFSNDLDTLVIRNGRSEYFTRESVEELKEVRDPTKTILYLIISYFKKLHR